MHINQSTGLQALLQRADERVRAQYLQVKRRQAGAPEPMKFMGCGDCDSLSRSVTLGNFVDDAARIARVRGAATGNAGRCAEQRAITH